jgi:hypothetical protein
MKGCHLRFSVTFYNINHHCHICINTTIDNFIVNIIVFLVIFVSSGYSLMAVIYPEESCSGLLKKPF